MSQSVKLDALWGIIHLAEMRRSAASPSAITDRAFEKSISKKHISHIGQIPKWLLLDNFFFFFLLEMLASLANFAPLKWRLKDI